MSKALVIRNADFSENKIETINFDNVPCTALSLDQSSATISTVDGTLTLTATKTPSNTTDAVTWTSSAVDVATVQNGVVTAIKEGTATITAKCGNITATCAVTVQYQYMFDLTHGLVVTVSSGNLLDYATTKDSASSFRPIIYAVNSGNLPAFGAGKTLSEGALKDAYPIPIPDGCIQIQVTCEHFAPIICYFKRNVKSVQDGLYRDCAKVTDGETTSAGTAWSISGWTYNSRTFNVPENVDSFVLSFNSDSATAHDNFSVSDVTIEYLYV